MAGAGRAGIPALGTDEADAVLCALTAVCHGNQVQERGRALPELWLPGDEFAITGSEPDGAQLVRHTEWIYFPNAARGADG